MKIRSSHRSRIRTILLAVATCLASLMTNPVVAIHHDSVWMFNHRDTFLDIACLDEENAVIVGDRGQVLVTHGKYNNMWAPRDSGTKEMLTALSFSDEQYGWAVGHGGIIIHTKDGGDSWEVQRESSPQNLPLFDVQFVTRAIGINNPRSSFHLQHSFSVLRV